VKIVRMNTSVKLGLRVTAVVAVLLGLGVASYAQVYDNFDSYTNNQVLATATAATVSGSPWGRFGGATAANPIALTNAGVAGSVAMDYALNYSGGNNASLVFHFPGTNNLSSVMALSVDLRVSTALLSNTIVEVAEEQANGPIYQTLTTLAQVLTNTTFQTFTLNLNSADMSNQGTAGAFDLSQVIDLRIRFQNVTSGGSQHIYVDNFQAVSVPEPSTLALMVSGIGLGLGVIRRRRS
jgi:hypothetical protein